MILVNTIGHVKSGLHLNNKFYGWVMASFGLGAAIAAFVAGSLDKTKTRSISLTAGALVLGASICFANYTSYSLLLVLWLFAGLGQSLAEMPSETLIAENIDSKDPGKVYGSHFAFSHLWWAITYPVAGVFGTLFPSKDFLYGGLLTLLIASIAMFILKPSSKLSNK